MADRYWVGGPTGDFWSATTPVTGWATTSGGANNQSVPTAADNVFFDASSPACNVNSGATCRSANFTGYTNTLAHAAGTTLTIGDGTAAPGNAALVMVGGMTYSLINASTSAIQFQSTNGTQQTITTAGKTLGSVTFAGAGSSYLLSDTFTATGGTVSITAGTLDTGNQTITASIVNTSGSTTRVLTLGSSTINLSSSGTAWGFSAVTGLTFNANTSSINLSGGGPTFQGGGLTYNNVTFTGGSTAVIVAANTYANFTYTGTAAITNTLQLNNTPQTITSTFTITGNSTSNRILVTSNVLGSSRTISAATVTITNCDFKDITGSGAGTWSGTSIGNALGNSGITFTTPVTRYAVAAGSWSSTAVWSTSSGGGSGASHPICHDTVILDASSGAGTYTQNMARPCADLTCTGFTRTLSMSSGWATFGSVTLGSGMTLSGTGAWDLQGRGSHTITTAGIIITSTLDISSFGGTYTLQDNMEINRAANGAFTLNTGTFNATSRTITLSGTTSSLIITQDVNCILTITNATVNLGGTNATSTWNMGTQPTLNASGSTINLTAASANTRTFAGGGKTYGTLNYTVAGSTGQLTISGANTFNTLNFTDSTNARTLVIPQSATQTITTLNCSGGSGRLITINSASAGTAGTISIASGTTSLDYISLKDITMSGGASFYAGNNSTNTSNNTGMYWFAPLTGTGAGFNPLSDITWTAAYWANDAAWTSPGNGLGVSSLRDGSGNSRTMTQGTGSLQPIYTTYDTDVNSRATLTFDGTDDYLGYATGFTLAQPLTVLAIAKSTDPANQEPIICQTAQIFSNFKGSTGDSYRMTAPTAVDYGTTDTAKHFARFFFNGASSAIQVDDSTSGALNPGTNGFSTIATGLGANAGSGTPTSLFSGEIAFVGVYNGDITANANWNDFLGWVSDMYGINGGYSAGSTSDFFQLF